MDERHWRPFQELLEKDMLDPVRRRFIIEARKCLASTLYPDGGPEYDRMMRGEGPSDSALPAQQETK